MLVISRLTDKEHITSRISVYQKLTGLSKGVPRGDLPVYYSISVTKKNITIFSVTSHISCIATRCLINMVYLTAYAFIRS